MVGVPVMVPVLESIDRPGGSVPPSPMSTVAVDEVSDTATVSGVMALPETFDWFPGLVAETWLVTAQVNETWAEKLLLSVTVTVTGSDPAVVGVPVMAPVPELMERPAGNPVAA